MEYGPLTLPQRLSTFIYGRKTIWRLRGNLPFPFHPNQLTRHFWQSFLLGQPLVSELDLSRVIRVAFTSLSAYSS